jgi:histidine triad (HIT) family protein
MPIDPALPYDDQNIFAKILRDEIPSRRVYEDDWAVAFHDIAPHAPTHVLVIPRGAYVSWDDFAARGSEAEIAGFVRAVGTVARQLGLVESGYRLLANIGRDAGPPRPPLRRTSARPHAGALIAPARLSSRNILLHPYHLRLGFAASPCGGPPRPSTQMGGSLT